MHPTKSIVRTTVPRLQPYRARVVDEHGHRYREVVKTAWTRAQNRLSERRLERADVDDPERFEARCVRSPEDRVGEQLELDDVDRRIVDPFRLGRRRPHEAHVDGASKELNAVRVPRTEPALAVLADDSVVVPPGTQSLRRAHAARAVFAKRVLVRCDVADERSRKYVAVNQLPQLAAELARS